MSSAAVATDKQREFKLHHDAGVENYLSGSYERAIAELQAAYALIPEPLLLFDIAQAYRKQGVKAKAIEFYRRYLVAEPRAKDRAAIERRIIELDRPDHAAKVDEPARLPVPPLPIPPPPPVDPPFAPPPKPISAVSGPGASTDIQTALRESETEIGPDHRIRILFGAGGAVPRLLGPRHIERIANLLGGASISGSYVAWLPHSSLDIGLAANWSPIIYTPDGDQQDVRSDLFGLLATVSWRAPIVDRLFVGPTLAAGVTWWGGLVDRNPFSGVRSDGPVPMPSIRASVAGLSALGSHLLAGIDLGISYAKTTGESFSRSVTGLLRLDANAFVGVGF